MSSASKNNGQKNNNNNKKKKISSDAIALLVILAVIIIATVLMAFLSSGNNVSKLNGMGGGSRQKKDGSVPFEMVLVCGFVAVFIIVLLVIKKVRDTKRKAKLKAEQMEKARRMKELEDAKARVRRAKMNEFLMAGENELEKRKKEEALLRNRRNQKERGNLQDLDRYSRRDLNDFRDELPELDSYEEENFIQRLIRKIRELFSRKNEDD